jgi:hypothetical protein
MESAAVVGRVIVKCTNCTCIHLVFFSFVHVKFHGIENVCVVLLCDDRHPTHKSSGELKHTHTNLLLGAKDSLLRRLQYQLGIWECI